MSEFTSFLRKAAGRALSIHPAMSRMTARIAIDEHFIPYMFSDPRLPMRLSAVESLRRDFLALVGDDRLLGAILDDPLLSERIYLSEPARRQLQANPRVQHFLLHDAQVIDVISKNKDIAAALARDGQWRERMLEDESFRAWAAENDALLELALGHKGIVDKIVRADHLLGRLIQHPACLESVAGDEAFVERLFGDRRVIDRWLAQPGWPALAKSELLKRLGADPAAVDEFLRDERVLDRFYASDPVRQRVQQDKKLLLELASAGDGLSAIVSDKPLLNRILAAGGIAEILGNEELLGAILGNAKTFDRLIDDAELTVKLLWNEKFLGRLLANETLLFKVLSNERAWTKILSDDQFLSRLISNERAWGKILANDALLTKLVANGKTLERILFDDQLLMRLIPHERVWGKILADDGLLTKLVSNGRALEKIFSDDQLLMRIIPHERVWGKILADDVLLTKLVSNGRALEKILSDDQLLMRIIPHERVFGKILADDVLLTKLVSNGRALEKILSDDQLLTRFVSNERVFGKILADDVLLTKFVSNGRVLERIVADEGLFAKLVSNDRAVRVMLADESISARILAQPKLAERIRENGQLLGRIVLNEGAVRNLMADPAMIESRSIDSIMQAHAEFRRIWRALEPFIDAARPEIDDRLHASLKALTKPEEVPERLLDVICDGDKVFLAGGALAFTDRFSLWTELNELLIDEDYYFETDAAEPRILDCGSNFGLAIYYFKRLYPGARITAFEPVPSLQSMIRSNVRDNRMDGVDIEPYALSAEAGENVFYESINYPMAGSLTGRRRDFGDRLREIRVDCKPLSRYLDEPVHFLKLDIEGSEDTVLAEAAGKLGAVENMFVEYHHGAGMPEGRLEAILRILDRAGFDWQVGKSFHFGRQTRRRALTYSGQPYSLNIWARKK